MRYMVTINGKNYEVEVEKGQAMVLGVTQAPVVQAPVKSEPAPVAAAAEKPVATGGGELLRAPMPGTVLSIKVNPGASVKRGDILMILEAMKMENEITAPRDGKVSGILAGKGQSVSTGDPLLELI